MLIILIILSIDKYYIKKLLKMKKKEEILQNLLKNLLDTRLKRLEKRNIEQIKDIKLEKESYNKQGVLLKKLCSVKIEPKNNSKKNNTNNKLIGRVRNKTPTNIRSRTKSTLKEEDKKLLRSKTPNITLHKKKPEKKEKEKGKNDTLKKISKTPLKEIRKPQKSNNIKVSSYMVGITTNLNKNKKDYDKFNTTVKKGKTPDIRKSKQTKKKTSVKESKIDNNIKLIDIKVDDMKNYIETEEKKPENKEEIKKEIKEEIKIEKNEKKNEEKIEEKNEEKNEEKKEERIINYFEPIIDNNKIMNTISSFLNDSSQYNFFTCNKKLTKYLYEKLLTSLEILKTKNNITSSSTVQDQINTLKLKYQNDKLNEEPPKFSLSKGTVKAIELLNEENYSKIFTQKELNPPLNEILLVYRIFFQLLNNNNICTINDDKLFWYEASEYILKTNNGKIGDFFKESIKNFDFSIKNIYKVKKVLNGNEEKIKPTVFSKYCGTTGLIIFLIKDTLEYLGIIHNVKKNIPCLLLKYLEYVKEIQNKIENYINDIKKINNNI